MSDEQEITLLLGFIAAALGPASFDITDDRVLVSPDSIELFSPFSGRSYKLTLERLKGPGRK